MNENVRNKLEKAAGLLIDDYADEYINKRLHVSINSQLYWYYSVTANGFDVVVESAFPSGCGRSLNTASISVHEAVGSAEGMYLLHFTLKEKDDRHIFVRLILDLIDYSDDCTSAEEGISNLVDRFSMWKAMLKHRGEGRGVLKGVIGELVTMKKLLEYGKDPDNVIDGWGGPDATQQDFILSDMWVETKSVGTHATVVTINSLGQLDKPDKPGYLHVVTMDECASTDDEAVSFASLFNSIDTMLVGNAVARLHFKNKMKEFEYIRFAIDDPIYFKVQATKVYTVDEAFPKLKNSAAMTGIKSVHYELLLSVIEKWALAKGEKVWL